MSRRRVVHLAAAVYALVDVGAIMAPSLVLALTAHKGGLSGSHGIDLVLVSSAVAMAHAAIAFSRLTDESRDAVRHVDVWIAAFDALVVLGLGATGLLIVVLGGFAEHHAVLVNRGWWVVWLWLGVLLAAVALAELSGRYVFHWLEREGEARASVAGPGRALPETRSDRTVT